MSTVRVTYRTCNGCHRGERDEDIEIVQSKPYHEFAELHDGRTIDLCHDCSEAGRYICRLCRSVHDDEHPCDAMAALDKALFEPPPETAF